MNKNTRKNNFWKKLRVGFLALAPIAGVSDMPFRQLCREYGAEVLHMGELDVILNFLPEKIVGMIQYANF